MKSSVCSEHSSRPDSSTCSLAPQLWDFTVSLERLKLLIFSSARRRKTSRSCARRYVQCTKVTQTSTRYHQAICLRERFGLEEEG